MAGNQPYPPQYAPHQYAPPPGYATPGESLDPRPPASNMMHVGEPQPMAMTTGQDNVPDNIIISILSIFCCPILGIVATFMAYRANNSKNKPGGLERAKHDAAIAKKLAIAGIIVGCFLTIIVPILIFVAGGVLVAKTVDLSDELVKETGSNSKDPLFTTRRPPTIDDFFDNF